MNIQKSPPFLTFGRDPILPLNILLVSQEALKNMFEIAATNIRTAREKGDPENNHLPTKLQLGDTVLIQNHTRGPFDPKYIGDYWVVAIKGNQVEIRPSVGGPTEIKKC